MLSKLRDVKRLAEWPLALTIAGFDPSSGAGITADLEVFRNQSVRGVAAITALTVQSTRGVRRVDPIHGEYLRETLTCLGEDHAIRGVKIGMLGTPELVTVVTQWLRTTGIGRERIVLDPVIRATSGAELLTGAGVEIMRRDLLPVVGWVTPNVAEAAQLAGSATMTREAVPRLAEQITALVPGLNVIVTGGHLDSPNDFLRTAQGEEQWFPGFRVEPRGWHGTHGTGCAFSSALLCRILAGDTPADAVRRAKELVVERLKGPSV